MRGLKCRVSTVQLQRTQRGASPRRTLSSAILSSFCLSALMKYRTQLKSWSSETTKIRSLYSNCLRSFRSNVTPVRFISAIESVSIKHQDNRPAQTHTDRHNCHANLIQKCNCTMPHSASQARSDRPKLMLNFSCPRQRSHTLLGKVESCVSASARNSARLVCFI